MASIEKLVKAFEALKVIQTPIDKPEEALVSTRFIKKETSLTKKDKIIHCNTIADIICCPSLRNIEDFHKFLGIAIETFLVCCDDNDSDVRMVSNECLNRTIKNLMDSQLGRIQVELYKEIKKNGSSRSLRAALSRFADLCHLTRAAKCRPYVLNLFPCLAKISERIDEEVLNETLRIAITKIMPVLGSYASDNEIINLLTCFIPNLQFTLASVRRTASSSLVVICQYSRKPQVFFSWLLSNLLQLINKVTDNKQDSYDQQLCDNVLIGIFLCIKDMIPHLYDIPSQIESESLKSFGLNQKQTESIAKDCEAITENLLQIYELILFNIRYNNNHNVILSSLEALQQFMKTPPKMIFPYLIDSKGIDKSRLGSHIRPSTPSSPILSLMRNKRMHNNNSMSCSSINVASLDDEEYGSGICGVTTFDDKSDRNSVDFDAQTQINDQSMQSTSVNESYINSEKSGEMDSLETSLEMSKVDNDESLVFDLEKRSFNNSNKFLSSSFQATKLTYVEYDDSFIESRISPCASDSFDAIEEKFNNGNIGEFITESITSLDYCVRLLCSQFLLNGCQNGLIPDKVVRVSVKSLALGCIASIFRLNPKPFIINLYIDVEQSAQNNESSQKIWDISLYSSHNDPQIRGQIAIIIGYFIREMLNQPIPYNDYLLKHCSVSAYAEAPSLEQLLSILVSIINDRSAIATKHGLTSLRLCFNKLLNSNDSINMNALLLIDDLIELRHNSYWLVKTELVETFADIDYKVIHYLEVRSQSFIPNNIIVNKEFAQNKILEQIFLPFIADEDYRVREAACVALTKVISSMFTTKEECDNDPIIGIAYEHTIFNLPEKNNYFQATSNFMPFVQTFTDPINSSKLSSAANVLLEANLLHIVNILKDSLLHSLDNKFALFGYSHALSLLSETFPVLKYPHCWGCDFSDKSTATKLVNFAIALLSTNVLAVLDLNTHQDVITLAINLLEGLAYQLIKSNMKSDLYNSELEWGVISAISPYLTSQFESLFNHLLKIMNIYSYIIDDYSNSVNMSASNKIPVIQTLSNSTLSPIRKKSAKLNEGEKPESKNILKKVDSDKSEKDKNTKLQFASNPILCKLFEILRSSFISWKTSMDLKGEKITLLLSVTLNSFSRILEMSTLKFTGKYSEEILQCLKVVFALEPSYVVKNVRQLLKCIFGTNYIVMFSNDNYLDDVNHLETENDETPANIVTPVLSVNSTSGDVQGLYNYCFAVPYTKFTQFYASQSSRLGSNYQNFAESDLTFSSWLRKKIDKRVAFILDKKVANSSIAQNTKASLTTHIRLFEPIVIKALKQYTVTTDVHMQCQVLDLLSQLVQLRVNYCLLDSDQIFIGFVLKQFEFIESGQFQNYDQLIGHIFFFLVLLSYERYHSKPIIGIPKIIQLCDGIIASGNHTEKLAITAIQVIVEDLMLLRSPSKVDSSKDLDAQREVIVANCLKLIQFPQTLQILLIIIKQSRKEGEEKWKKMSRQIIDFLLPQLIKQKVHIDCYDSLDVLHSLFESVSTSVFRPVDILLKALFAAPHPDLTNNYYFFHRWTSMILVILRVIIVQTKEEVVLARLEELKNSIITIGPFGLPVIPISASNNTDSIPFHMSSLTSQCNADSIQAEDMLASYLLQIIQLCIQEIETRNNSIYNDIVKHCEFLVQLISNYILILTHMFQSGLYRRVAKAAMALIKTCQFQENSDNSTYLSGFSLTKTNASFITIMSVCPTLALQWFNLLMLLNYEDYSEDGLWNNLLQPNLNYINLNINHSTGKRKESSNKTNYVSSPSIEIIRRGSLILLCDFVSENMKDAEHMTWLIVQNINEIINMCNELPISEFISSIHRNSSSSGLFIQAINARCDENLRTPSFIKRLLHCLERVHPSQSASLVTFIIEKIISNQMLAANHLIIQNSEVLACNRVSLMTSPLDVIQQRSVNHISENDLNKLISCVDQQKHKNLFSKLVTLRKDFNSLSISQTHPLSDNLADFKMPNISKDWFLLILQQHCKRYSNGNCYKAAYLLNKLSYDDIIFILTSRDFSLEILGECIEFSDQNLVDEDYKSTTKIKFSAVMNRINLLKASLTTVMQHVNYFMDVLPTPYYSFLPHSEMYTPKEARHRHKIIELFSDSSLWKYMFKLSSGFLSYLKHHTERSIPQEVLANVVRIAILYSEAAQYMTESAHNASYLRIVLVLKIMNASINCGTIFAYLSDSQTISYQCTFISAIYSLTKYFYGELPKVENPESFAKNENLNPELKHPHKCCIRMAQLVNFIEIKKFDSKHVPSIIESLLRKIILNAARLPLVNSFVMVPINVWNIRNDVSWNPNFSGDSGTILSTIPSDYLYDREILEQFRFRITQLGWTSRIQFEEIWMSLLGVFGATSNNTDSNEEQLERISINLIAVKTISDLLLFSTLLPQKGNPIRSKFIKQKKEKVPTFLHTRFGEKLQSVREPLLMAINLLINNNEESNHYECGQISVELLRNTIKSMTTINELSPSLSTSSSSSSSGYSPLSPINNNKISSPNNEVSFKEKNEIDVNSCLHFLLDLYGQILSLQRQIQLPLLTEICRSILLLSDLFNEKSQFEWMLDTYLEVHRIAQLAEDEVISQYLVVGICKASAVLGLDSETIIDRLKKIIDVSLRSPFLPTRIATLHGLKYIIEFRGVGVNGKETLFLPIVCDYLIKHLSDNSLPSSHNLEHVEQMWKIAFHVIEHFVEDFSDSEFCKKVFQLCLKVISDKTSLVFLIVMNGLEQLLLCEKFNINEINVLVKACLDRFKSASCQLTSIVALNLITSSTYFVGSVGFGLDKNIDDNEEFFLAMEKLSVIFERLKICLSFEAEQICNILPHFLCEFYPTQDILNKCIGEFLSGQQTHARHLANILFLVFNKLQNESRLDIVHDWVILSLSSFTQLIPLSHAIWSLTIFLMSASINCWIRYIFPYVQTRFGLLEKSDRELFCVVCCNFYNELKTDENRLAFRSAYQVVSDNDSPYADVLRILQLSK